MAEFNRVIITKAGQSLMSKLMSGTGTVEFTKLSISSTKYNQSQLENLTSLSNVRQSTPVAKVYRNNNVSITAEGAVSNENLTQGYHMETIGLYAKDPSAGEVLYAVTIASNADYMPPFNGLTVSGSSIKITVTVGNAENVSVQVDPAGYATVGDVNRLESRMTEMESFFGYEEEGVLGLEVDYENNRYTRLADAVGRTPGASFDKFEMYGGRRRCVVADNGQVNAYFGQAGYIEDGSNGQVMVEQPNFYYKVVPLKTSRIEDGQGNHLLKARYYVSDTPKQGFKIHPAFVDESGAVRERIYVSAYEGSIYNQSAGRYMLLDEQVADLSSDKLSSIAGAKPASGITQHLHRDGARQMAGNRGKDWGQMNLATLSMTQLLFIIEYGSLNSQEALGRGVVSISEDSGNNSILTGATASFGNASGNAEEGSLSYRGEENLWGNIWTFFDGFTLRPHGEHKAWFATGGYKSNGTDGTYQDLGFTPGKAGGYVKYFGYSEVADFVFIPSATGGNSIHPVGDNYYQNSGYSRHDFMSALVGGRWADGSAAGLFLVNVHNWFGHRYRNFGARLVYTPSS